jgi:hypothetical protein
MSWQHEELPVTSSDRLHQNLPFITVCTEVLAAHLHAKPRDPF